MLGLYKSIRKRIIDYNQSNENQSQTKFFNIKRLLEISLKAFILNGRDDMIRTCDPLVPSEVRYQAALHPGVQIKEYYKKNYPSRVIKLK